MKKNLKSLVIGIIIGATAVSVPAMADVIWEKIDVFRNGITVMVDGSKLDADNFVYNDTTYVPIRAVAESMGRNVDYRDGVAYIEEQYTAKFGGEKVELGNGYTATTEEISAYKTMFSKSSEMANATDEQLHKKAIDAISEYYKLSAVAAEYDIYAGKDFYNNFSNVMSYMELNYGSKEAMYSAMESAGFTYEMYKRSQETDYLFNELSLHEAFAVTHDEVLVYYAENPDQFPYDGVQAKHILISTMDENGKAITNNTTLKALEKKANDVYRLAAGGADFDKLIEEYGEDPGTAANPDGYTFTKGEMVEEFETTAFALNDGQISKPVKTAYGWHIIKRIKKVDVQPLTQDMVTYIENAVKTAKIYEAINAK